jgi:hypothetical protein
LNAQTDATDSSPCARVADSRTPPLLNGCVNADGYLYPVARANAAKIETSPRAKYHADVEQGRTDK